MERHRRIRAIIQKKVKVRSQTPLLRRRGPIFAFGEFERLHHRALRFLDMHRLRWRRLRGAAAGDQDGCDCDWEGERSGEPFQFMVILQHFYSNLGLTMLSGAALVLGPKAPFKSQCRFRPCTASSVCTIKSDTWRRINPLACTWAFKLLVRLPTFSSVTTRLLTITLILVCAAMIVLSEELSTWSTRAATLVRTGLAVTSRSSACVTIAAAFVSTLASLFVSASTSGSACSTVLTTRSRRSVSAGDSSTSSQ